MNRTLTRVLSLTLLASLDPTASSAFAETQPITADFSVQRLSGSTLAALARLERRIGPERPAQLPTASNVALERERQSALVTLSALRRRLANLRPSSSEQRRSRLESLGYAPQVAQKLAQLHPGLADEIQAWSEVDAEGASARTLYRGLALDGGIAGLVPSLDSGLEHPVHVRSIYIADDWLTARDFAFDRAGHGGKPVLLVLQVPRFMVQRSPLQMGDSTWPMIRAEDLPDPENPDLTAFILGYAELTVGSRSSTSLPELSQYPR